MDRVLAGDVIDISATADGDIDPGLARRLDNACRESGFFILTGHGVPDDVVSRAYTVSRAFFDLPVEAKEACHPRDGSYLGYRGVNHVRSSTSAPKSAPPDMKEIFAIGAVPRDGTGPAPARLIPDGMWPPVAGFADALAAYYGCLQRLGERLARLFATALGVREDFFSGPGDIPGSALVTINYPHAPEKALDGQMRSAEHRDRNLFTVLSVSAPGLEVQDRHGTWRNVPVVPGGFVVNLGTMFSVWTRGEWMAAMHRVPASSSANLSVRQSLVFFFNPDFTKVIQPIGVEGVKGDAGAQPGADGLITAADHLRSMWELHR